MLKLDKVIIDSNFYQIDSSRLLEIEVSSNIVHEVPMPLQIHFVLA